MLNTSFRGVLGGLKTTFGGPKSVEAYGPRPLSNANLGLSIPPVCTAPLMLELLDAVHKGDFQKVDDAAVPVHLWLRAFALGYGDPGCLARQQVALGLVGGSAGSMANTEPPLGWQGSMAGFCVFGLRYWKRRVVRGYHRWRLTNLPRQANLPTPAQFVQCRMGMVLGSVQLVYGWTDKGEKAYHTQWSLLRGSEDGLASVEAGHDAVCRSANASWFEWLEGSAPLFWNWPERYQREVRDRQPHFMTGKPGPPFLRAQSKHKDPAKHKLMRAKVVKVRKLDYTRPGEVISGTNFLSVDKGETDIWMVYNGTSCGLNDILYAPHFGLPTVRETLRSILPGFHQCDLNVQDQFLNFILHKHMREYSGVDVRKVQSVAEEDTEWELARPGPWER